MQERRLAPTEAAAGALGNRLVQAGLAQHVCGAHAFENAYLFYRLGPPPVGYAAAAVAEATPAAEEAQLPRTCSVQRSALLQSQTTAAQEDAGRAEHEMAAAVLQATEEAHILALRVAAQERELAGLRALLARLLPLLLLPGLLAARSLASAAAAIVLYAAVFLLAAAAQPQLERLVRCLAHASDITRFAPRAKRATAAQERSRRASPDKLPPRPRASVDARAAPVPRRRSFSEQELRQRAPHAKSAALRETASEASMPAIREGRRSSLPSRVRPGGRNGGAGKLSGRELTLAHFERSADRPLLVRLTALPYQRCLDVA